MQIKIVKTDKEQGIAKAFVVKIKGLKFPRGFQDWYFVNSKEKALELALRDWLDLKVQEALANLEGAK